MSRLGSDWTKFWFQPVSTAPLALFRLAFGLVVVAWAITLLPDAETFFGPDGVLPEQPAGSGKWGFLGYLNEPGAATATVSVLGAAAGALAVGWRTRIAAALVFACITTLSHRNPFVGNSGDALLRTFAFFLMLAPAGAALSLDRLRRGRDAFWDCPKRAAWGLRLIQIQFSLVYLATFWAKLRGDEWPDGTAVATALRLEDLQRYDLPDVGSSLALVGVATWGTLAIELALGTLVWMRRFRPWVLGAGVALHLGIHVGLRIGAFSFVILSAYAIWVDADAIVRRIRSLRWRARGGSTRS